MPGQRSRQAALGIFQHGVKEGDGKALLAQQRCRIQCSQGWVRLHLPHLLGVIEQVVGVSQQNIDHGACPSINRTVNRGGIDLLPSAMSHRQPPTGLNGRNNSAKTHTLRAGYRLTSAQRGASIIPLPPDVTLARQGICLGTVTELQIFRQRQQPRAERE